MGLHNLPKKWRERAHGDAGLLACADELETQLKDVALCHLCICAAILSERRLSALEDGKSAALQTEITQDAICKAERIMRQIDALRLRPSSIGKLLRLEL